jgi:hypothetical protein
MRDSRAAFAGLLASSCGEAEPGSGKLCDASESVITAARLE